MDSLGLIITIVSYVLLALIVGLAFLIGYKRGVKRSLIHFATNLVFVIVAFLITPSISRAILGININQGETSKPLSQIIVDAVSSSSDVKTAVENSPTLKSFLEALPGVVISVVVFLVLYAFMRLLGYIVYKIIEKTTLKSKKEEVELGIKRNKWAGAGIGALKGFVFTFIALAPLTALLGFVNDLRNETQSEYSDSSVSEESVKMAKSSSSDSLPTIDELFDSIPSSILNGIDAYNNNVFGVVGGAFGFDNFVFDNLTKISVDGESIKFRQDALEYVKVYNTFVDIKNALDNSVDTTVFKNINWDSIDKTFDKIINSGLVKGLFSNVAGDFIKNYDKFTSMNLSEYQNIFEALKTSLENADIKTYFIEDLKEIYKAVSTAGRSGLLDEIYKNKDSQDYLLDNVLVEKNKTTISQITDNLLNLNIVRDTTIPVVEYIFDKAKIEEYTLSDNATKSWNKFKRDIIATVENAISINDTIKITSVLEEPLSLMNINEDKIDNVLNNTGIILDKIDSLLKTNSDKKAVETMLKNADLSNLLSVRKADGTKDGSVTSYQTLLSFLSAPVKKLRSLDLYEEIKDGVETDALIKIVGQKLNSSNLTIEDIFLPLYKVDGLRDKLISVIDNEFQGNEIINFSVLNIKDSNDKLVFTTSYNNWSNDLQNLTSLLKQITTQKLEGTDKIIIDAVLEESENEDQKFIDIAKTLTDSQIENILKPVMYTNSTRPLLENMLTIIVDTLNDVASTSATIEIKDNTFVKADDEDQATEVCNILNHIKALLNETSEIQDISSLSKTQLGKLLDTIKLNAYRQELNEKENEGLFRGLFEGIYGKMLNEYPEASNIIGSKEPYEFNYENLLSLVDQLQNAQEIELIEKVTNLISSEEEITVENVTNMIDSLTEDISPEQTEQINNILDTISETGLNLNVIPGVTEDDIKANSNEIETAINNTTLSDETKAKLKELLGITYSGEESQTQLGE